MKCEIHYFVNDIEDSAIIEGETTEDIQNNVTAFFSLRGLDIDDIRNWSREI